MAQTFAYTVRDRQGQVVTGVLEGDSESVVVSRLRGMGYLPVAIESRGKTVQREIKIPGLSDRVPLKDVAVFSRQFATMVNAGLSLLRSLSILAEQTENKELARIISAVRDDIEQGSSLSVALARRPKAFNRLYVSMVKAGEVGGMLDVVLLQLATTIEGQVALRRKVKSAMSYPVVVGALIVLIVTAMLLFIVPTFEGMYADLGGTLPLPTRILLGASRTFSRFWYLVAASAVAAAVLLRRWVRTEAGRRRWDTVKLRIPVFGALAHKVVLARFARSLSALVRSGVPILTALEIVADTANNTVVARALQDADQAVKGGEPLSRPLAGHAVFPPMVVQMMAVGEETGALDELLGKIADFYDSEVEATVDALTSLLEPMLIVVMGVAVGSMVVALYMPMFNIVKAIG